MKTSAAQGNIRQAKRRKPTTSMSKMNGDNLSQLRSMKQAEVSPRVQSYNLSTRVEMVRKINWCFREQNMIVDKMNKAQFQMYKELKRVHQEKRRMMRESWHYRQEEARQEIVRNERDRKVKQIFNDYDTQSREILGELYHRKLRRKKMVTGSNNDRNAEISISKVAGEKLPSVKEEPDVNILILDKDISKEKITDDRLEATKDRSASQQINNKLESLTIENLKNHDIIMGETSSTKHEPVLDCEPSLVRESSKVLEVNPKDLKEPKTRLRFKEDNNIKNETASKSICNQKLNKSPTTTDRDNEHFIFSVSEANKIPDGDKHALTDITKQPSLLPPIKECLLNNEEVEKKKFAIKEDSSELYTKDSNILVDEKYSEQNVDEKNETMVEFMKRRARELDIVKKKILEEPYTAYMRDRHGKIVPLEVPPKPFNNSIPSTRAIYLRDKALERQTEINLQNETRIQQFFEKIEREEEELRRRIEEQMMLRRKAATTEVKTNLKSGPSLPPMTMTMFLQKYPEEWDLQGMDPNSVEILRRCRYIRFQDGTIREIDSKMQDMIESIWPKTKDVKEPE